MADIGSEDLVLNSSLPVVAAGAFDPGKSRIAAFVAAALVGQIYLVGSAGNHSACTPSYRP